MSKIKATDTSSKVIFFLLVTFSLTSAAPIGSTDHNPQPSFITPIMGLIIFAISTGWMLLVTAAGSMATNSDSDPNPAIQLPTLTPCSSAENVLKNVMEVIFVFPCCTAAKCSFSLGIWLARGSPLTVLLKVTGASFTSGATACILGYIGAYFARDTTDIQVSWEDASNGRMKRMVPAPPTPSQDPKLQILQVCLIASLPMVLVAFAMPLLNGVAKYYSPKVGKCFSICLVSAIALLLAVGVFLVAFSAFSLTSWDNHGQARMKRAAMTTEEVEDMFGMSLTDSSTTTILPTTSFNGSTERPSPDMPSSATDGPSSATDLPSSATNLPSSATDFTTKMAVFPSSSPSNLATPSSPMPSLKDSSAKIAVFTTTAFSVVPSTTASNPVESWMDSAEEILSNFLPTTFSDLCETYSNTLGLLVIFLLALRFCSLVRSCCSSIKNKQAANKLKKIHRLLQEVNDRVAALPTLTDASSLPPPPATAEGEEESEGVVSEQASTSSSPVLLPIPPPPPPPPAHN